MSILIFLLVLFVLILVHEWGHFIVAKKTGMRVDEFGIGFPPKLFGKKRGETEYTVNALPIGGFVRILGEDGSVEDEQLSEADRARTFSARPKWAQALVLVAGISMNILFAWFLFTLTNLIGVTMPVKEADASPAAQLYVVEVLPESPAAAIPSGSVITTISASGMTVDRPTQSEFSELVRTVGASPVTISYRYEDISETVTVTPVQGLIASDPEAYAVGTSLSLIEVRRMGLGEAIVDGAVTTWRGLVAVCVGLFTLIKDALVGEADLSQVAGPVGIVGMVGEAASFGIVALLSFTAVISLNLAVINLLPFPALDGGRLVFVAIEAITRKQIPPEWAGRVNLVGFAILMLLMIVVTYSDIVKLL